MPVRHLIQLTCNSCLMHSKNLIINELPTSKDRVKFQPGGSLRDFFKRCGADDQCV